MSTGGAKDEASYASLAVRLSGAREAVMLAMLLYGLTQGVEAFADERSTGVVRDIQPMVGGRPLPKAFLPAPATNTLDTSTEPRWRRFDGLDGVASPYAAPLVQSQSLQQTTPWQRLADYRGQGRVQLLTLWASPSNMVSLQAGKHGGPSLQWSSRVMNHGGATKGLLDRFVGSSLGAAVMRSRTAARSSEASAAGKPISLIPTTK